MSADPYRIEVVARRTALCLTVLCALSCRANDARPSDSARAGGNSTPAAAPPMCNVETGTVLTGDGLGALRVGASVEEVAARCRVTRDTIVLGAEGTREREIRVDVGRNTVRAVIDGERVWRLHVTSPAFRTADSLGVGTRASALRRPGARVLTGEGGVYAALPSHCGLSFRLDGVAPGQATSLAQVPESTRVGEVLAFGCERSGSSPAR